MIVFSDGVEIDNDGGLRVEERAGLNYVVGEGNCLPVADEEAGRLLIRSIETRTTFMNMKVFKSPESRHRAGAAIARALRERELATDRSENTNGCTNRT